MLKNYTVIVKNVNINKNNNLLNYLNNQEHKNHKNKNTKIFELSNRNEFEKWTNEKLEKNNKNYKSNKKGGRKLKVVNKSFTFNLPKSYKEIASVSKCQEIDKKLKKEIIKIYKNFGTNITEQEMYSVLHYQDNPHIHLIIPYLDQKGNTIRNIKPKGFTSRLKYLFSQIVDNVLKTEIEKYQKLQDEENGINQQIRTLQEIKDWYKTIIRIDGIETKYYKNQIININRLLNENKEITQEQVNKIYNNMEKASSLRIKSKMVTPKTPFL